MLGKCNYIYNNICSSKDRQPDVFRLLFFWIWQFCLCFSLRDILTCRYATLVPCTRVCTCLMHRNHIQKCIFETPNIITQYNIGTQHQYRHTSINHRGRFSNSTSIASKLVRHRKGHVAENKQRRNGKQTQTNQKTAYKHVEITRKVKYELSQ